MVMNSNLMRLASILLLLSVICGGCRQQSVAPADPPASLGPATSSDAALGRVWKTEFARRLRRKYPNTVIYVEGREADGVHVYLGFDEGTHTTRHSSLCVRSDGTVWREFTRPDLKLEWRPVK